jgi:hypothetical protein
MDPLRPRYVLLIAALLAGALALRSVNLGFGLPAFYDPDEPHFVLKAYELLDRRTLNPGWFGHPGSTTIYLLAVIDVLVVAAGLASGRYPNLDAFAAAVYLDPGVIMLPSRFAMACIGTATILLLFLLSKRLVDRWTALLAAALLALNSLHVTWSQVIRTDIPSSLFMLASLYWAVRAADQFRLRHIAFAGLLAGLAMATKWPGGTVLIAAAGAIMYHARNQARSVSAMAAVLLLGATLVGLFVGSPYVFLDWQTALANVSGEVVSGHLGHSGRGLLGNTIFYGGEVQWSLGWIGLLLLPAGLLLLCRHALARITIVPALACSIGLVIVQPQIWSRWLTPILPLICLCVAIAAVSAVRLVTSRLTGPARVVASTALVALVLVPSAAGAIGALRERANDTRTRASDWARTHIPPGSRVLVEHLALDLRSEPWTILFPLGKTGCINGRNALSRGVSSEQVKQSRGGSQIVDLGGIPPTKLTTCTADYAILTYFDLYEAEEESYPTQMATYRRLLGDGATLVVFRPERGHSAGPVTRIVAIKSQKSKWMKPPSL